MSIDYAWTAGQLQQNLSKVLSPAVCFKVFKLLDDPAADYEKVVDILRADPYLAGKIVAMANVVQGGGRPAISSIGRALSVLGVRHARMLVVSTMLTAAMLEPVSDLAIEDVRRWTLGMGVAGDWLSNQRRGICRNLADSEAPIGQAVIGGLIKGLGPLILHAALGRTYEEVLGNPPRILDLTHREKLQFGTTHDQVTGWALQFMKCPPEMAECLQNPTVAGCGEPCARAVELLGATIAGLDTARAEPWLVDALPLLSVDVSELFDQEIPKMKARLQELAQALNVRLSDVETSRQETLAAMGSAVESLVIDSLQYNQMMGDSLREHVATVMEIENTADTDALTGVLNRRGFERRLGDFKTGMLGLLVFDLDKFKAINDTHGHVAGDRALVAVVHALQTTTPSPVLLGRFGGDEFLAIYRIDAAVDLKTISRAVDVALAKTHLPGELPITVSMGGAAAGAAMLAENWLEVFAQADRRLYEAKQKGRHCAVLPV